MKNIIFVLLLAMGFGSVHAQKKTSVSAVVEGYNGKVIDFEFMNQEGINQQFPYREGQNMTFDVEMEDINLLLVNAYIWICLRPGDQIHADIRYDGRTYKTAEFSGTPEILPVNNVIRDIRNSRVARRYKMNILAAVVTQIPMLDYYKATQERLKTELGMLETKKSEIPADIYAFVYAEHEALLLKNLLSCPDIYAATGNGSNGTYPEDYWSVLNDYKLTDDDNALKSRAYMAFLLIYKDYMRKKEAYDKGMEYIPLKSVKAAYDDLAGFYDNAKLRENALFVFLYNEIVAGHDLDNIKALIKDYGKKYTKNKFFRKTLVDMIK